MTSPLDRIQIASPCSMSWDAMKGDDRMRFCGSCQLNVYNLSGMSRAEAEQLVLKKEGRLCVRFFRRDDGTLLTQDCPVGWAALRRRAERIKTLAVGLASAILSLCVPKAFAADKKEEKKLVPLVMYLGRVAAPAKSSTTVKSPVPEKRRTPMEYMGGMKIGEAVLEKKD
jgi:hypothetical protein